MAAAPRARGDDAPEKVGVGESRMKRTLVRQARRSSDNGSQGSGAGRIGAVGPTDATIAVLVNLSKVIFFGKLDALSLDLFFLALLMGLCTIPGTGCAAWLVRRTHVHLHTMLIEGLMSHITLLIRIEPVAQQQDR